MNILQVLHKDFQWIIDNMDRIAWTGYDVIQPHPLQPTKRPVESSDDFWLYYQPTDISIADKWAFINLCNEAHKNGLKISSDLVTRHLAGQDYNPLYPNEKDNSFFTSKREYWMDPINCSDWNNRWQVTHRCSGAPALNYENEDVFDKIIALFMDALAYGDYVRHDQGKQYGLPIDGCTFYPKLINAVGKGRIYSECIMMDDWNLQNQYSEYIMPLLHSWECRIDHSKVVAMDESHDSFFSNDLNRFSQHWSDETRLNRIAAMRREFPNILIYMRPEEYYDENHNHIYFGEDKTVFSDKMHDILHLC